MEEQITRVKAGSAVQVTDETRDTDDDLFTPDGGVTYDVIDEDGTVVVDGETMAESSTGIWADTFQSAESWMLGMYTVIAYAVHGGKTSIKENKNAFELY